MNARTQTAAGFGAFVVAGLLLLATNSQLRENPEQVFNNAQARGLVIASPVFVIWAGAGIILTIKAEAQRLAGGGK